MSRQTEKVMRAAHEFLEKNVTDDMSESEVNFMLQKFMEEYNRNIPEDVTEKTAETAEDFVELAEDAEDEAAAFNYAKKALKLEPNNLDAERIMAQCGSAGPIDLLKKLERAVKHGDQVMEKEGYLDEDSIGSFWGILETRPYMRLRSSYMETLCNCGLLKKAVEECEEMIRLSENDNLGIRYRLMHLYAFYEEETKALELHKRYEGNEETQMLLPLSVLYFKKGDWDKAEAYLKRLSKVNKDTGKFLKSIMEDDMDRQLRNMDSFGYRPFSIEELVMELMDNELLFDATPAYFMWAHEVLKGKKKC